MTAKQRLAKQRLASKHRLIAWIGLAALFALHLDFWRPQRPLLYFGWLPEEMAYRLAWMLLAWIYLLYFTRFVWTSEEDR